MKKNLSSSVLCVLTASTALLLMTTQPLHTVSAGSKAPIRGAELFSTQGCAHCHGAAGVGGNEGPDLQLVRQRMNKSQIARQIHDGGKSMPSYGDMLSSKQIDDLVAYLRAKRTFVTVPPKPAPTAPSDNNNTSTDPN